MNFKKGNHLSMTTRRKCSICGSQRRLHGAGDEKTRKRLAIMDRELFALKRSGHAE